MSDYKIDFYTTYNNKGMVLVTGRINYEKDKSIGVSEWVKADMMSIIHAEQRVEKALLEAHKIYIEKE